jgi:hypothetical protein
MSRVGHHRAGRAEPRSGRAVAIALLTHERDFLLRAVAELVGREGSSRVATDVEQMLRGAVPPDCLRELDAELTEAAP